MLALHEMRERWPEEQERLREWLRYYHRLLRCTQKELGKKIGMTDAMVNQVLSGKRGIGINALIAMHRNLGVRADELLHGDPPHMSGGRNNQSPDPNPNQASTAKTAAGRQAKNGGRAQ